MKSWLIGKDPESLSRVRLCNPWTAARQASLPITNTQSSLRLTSIESVMPSSHLILCRPLVLLPPIPPSVRVFSNESTLRMRWPKYGSFSLASVLPKKSQGWYPSEWTGWISLQYRGLSRVFSSTTVQKHQFFSAQLSSQSNSHIRTWPLEKPNEIKDAMFQICIGINIMPVVPTAFLLAISPSPLMAENNPCCPH